MATFNHKIEVVNGNNVDTFHPETNSEQVYDFTNENWLNSIIGVLSTLSTTQKSSLVAAINEIASKNSIEVVDEIPTNLEGKNVFFSKQSGSSNAPNKPTIEEVFDVLDSQASQFEKIDKRSKGIVNIIDYQHLVVDDDWTNAIKQAITDVPEGGTVEIPQGVYDHTGFRVPAKYINFRGSGRFGSGLRNISLNDAITIEENAERGLFKDLAILGNGTSIFGTNATSGHGIVFLNNSISWNFENVTVRGHGGDGFHGGDNGHVNNINIVNSEIEFNKGCAVHFVATAGSHQINGVNVRGCNIANNGGSGFELWGNSINIEGNTVQGNRKYGYDINSDLVRGSGPISCDSINIKGNYSEQNFLGLLHVKVDKIDEPRTLKYISTVNFYDNFGHENLLDSSVTSLVKIEAGAGLDGWGVFARAIKSFNYEKNSLYSNYPIPIFDGGDVLDSASTIISNSLTEGTPYYLNLGAAKFSVTNKLKVLNSFLLARGAVEFNDITTGRSENITENNTSIFYPVDMENYRAINMVGLMIDTDRENLRVDFIFHGRPSASNAAYTAMHTFYLLPTPGARFVESVTGGFNSFEGNDDIYLELKFYFRADDPGTFLHVYNPHYRFE
ncbi:hypothetical protein NSQ62_07700 [Solibacillus sp. FSL H8-0523]|uniref:hypothetical protein n=1 Tax=Solibacillus sp. FSL H8-0523 TaxID=2954511 RepID=UPI00310185A4